MKRPDEPGYPLCRATLATPGCPGEWWCTLKLDHPGHHEAWQGPRGEPSNLCARWPQ